MMVENDVKYIKPVKSYHIILKNTAIFKKIVHVILKKLKVRKKYFFRVLKYNKRQ